MDDLSALISQILSDPDSARQLQEAAAALGLTGNTDATAPQQSQTGNRQNQGNGNGNNRHQTSRSGQSYNNQRSYNESYNNQRSYNGENSNRNRQAPSPEPESHPQPQQPVAAPAQGSVPNVDLSALSQIISGLTGKTSAPQQPAPDLSRIAGLLGSGSNTPQQQQAPDLSGLMGLLGGAANNAPQQQSPPDLSGLMSLLGGNASAPQQQPALDLSGLAGLLGGNNPQQSAPDLSGLMGLLGGGGNQQAAAPDLSGLMGLLGGAGPPSPAGNSGVSALANLLDGGNSAKKTGGGLSGIDMNMILKVQQAMSTMNANQDNIRLLMGLKSHLNSERAQKVDDAVRIMQLIQFLPLLKESGLFGKFEDLLGNFGLDSIGDGLGSLLGGAGQGKGVGGLLGGLNLFGGR